MMSIHDVQPVHKHTLNNERICYNSYTSYINYFFYKFQWKFRMWRYLKKNNSICVHISFYIISYM
jgi:hypothetical protein